MGHPRRVYVVATLTGVDAARASTTTRLATPWTVVDVEDLSLGEQNREELVERRARVVVHVVARTFQSGLMRVAERIAGGHDVTRLPCGGERFKDRGADRCSGRASPSALPPSIALFMWVGDGTFGCIALENGEIENVSRLVKDELLQLVERRMLGPSRRDDRKSQYHVGRRSGVV
jgi:hypothetical protein